jgi:hypothetical protein
MLTLEVSGPGGTDSFSQMLEVFPDYFWRMTGNASKKWRIVSQMINGEERLTEPCMEDNFVTFRGNYTFEIGEGPEICPPGTALFPPQQGGFGHSVDFSAFYFITQYTERNILDDFNFFQVINLQRQRIEAYSISDFLGIPFRLDVVLEPEETSP